MVDIETLGIHADSVMLTIAAIQFDLESGDMGMSFSRTVDIEDQVRRGRTITGDTLKWWLAQNPETLKENLRAPVPLEQSLYDFGEFFYDNDLQFVWANGIAFDLAILKHAYRSIPLPLPWDSKRNERDYKTLREMLEPIEWTDFSTKHNALADCKYQIHNLWKIWKQFKKKEDGTTKK
jgi:hypothetical protein